MTGPDDCAAELAAFYEETDPEKRREMLSAADETAQRLFRFRFSEDLSEDRFLQAILNLMFLTRSSRTLKVLERRNARNALAGLGLYGSEFAADDREKELLLLEIRNAVLRYLMTCESDLYGRKFLGMIRSNEVQKAELIRRDLEDLSVRLPARLKAAGLSEFEEAAARLGEAVRSAAEQAQVRL